MYPAELFPTRYRAFAHGISAASGKAGAILASLAFNALSKKIGTPAVLWSKHCLIVIITSNTDWVSSLCRMQPCWSGRHSCLSS
jgi:hypothetical protein